MRGGGGAVLPPPVVFCPLLKKSSGHPYLKNHGLLVADTHMIFFFQKKLLTPSDSTFWTPSTKNIFCHLLKKSSGHPYLKIFDLGHYFFEDAPMKKKKIV